MKLSSSTLVLSALLTLSVAPISVLHAAPEAVSAARETSLSFAKAVALANERGPGLAKAQAQLDQAIAAKKEATGNRFPKLHADIEASRSDNPLNVFGMKVMQGQATFADFGAGEFNSQNPDVLTISPAGLNDPNDHQNITSRLQLDVPIYNGGKIGGYVKMADAYVGAAEMGKEYSRQMLILNTLKAYEGVRTAQAYVDVARLGQKTAQTYVDMTRNMHQQGLISKSDLLRAEVNYGEVELKVTEANNFLDNTAEQLRILTGLEAGTTIKVSEEITPSVPQGDVAALRDQALTSNSGLQALKKKVVAAKAGTKIARADYLPSFNMMLRQEWNAEDELGGDSSYTIGGVLKWDLLDLGARSGALDKSKAAMAQSRSELMAAQDELSVQIDKTWRDVKLAAKQVTVREKAIGQAKEAERLERLRYEQGISTLTQLLAVQTLLDKARADYVAARYQETMQRAGLLLALGKLDLRNLQISQAEAGLASDL